MNEGKLNKKRIRILILVLIIVVLIIIVNGFRSNSHISYIGNIYNMGLAIESNGNVYYNKYEKGIFKIKNGKEYKITDETAYSINIVNDTIYYLTSSPSGTVDIKSVETNGNNLQKISTMYSSISKIYVINDYIYYYSNDNVLGIAKIGIDGENKTTIKTTNVQDFQVVNDIIYFTDGTDRLYTMTLTGADVKELITDSDVKKFQVVGNWIYFYNEQENALYKTKTDGTFKTLVSNLVRNDTFNITNKKIYFFNTDDKEIASINLNGNGYKKIVSVQTNKTKINIAGNTLYYLDVSKDGSQLYQIYRVKTNGRAMTEIKY